jgi:glyoxylase-like metal-dependent hydrolase (beta-lactamase superfamily II)
MTVQVHVISVGLFNRFLIHDDGWILVDTGIPHTAGRVMRTLQTLGVEPSEVRLILLTHGHVDHAGSTRALQELTGARTAIHYRDQELLEKGRVVAPPMWNAAGRVMGALLVPLTRRMHFPPARADIVIGDEGLSLAEFGIHGQVISTPGHTWGSVSLLLDTGAAFVGDLGGAAGWRGGAPRIPPAGDDPQELVNSWKKLLAAGARTIYPGHGPSFPAQAMREALGL